MKDAAPQGRVFVTATGCRDIITADAFKLMQEDAIVCNIGHFDNELDIKWLNNNCVSRDTVKPQVPDTRPLIVIFHME